MNLKILLGIILSAQILYAGVETGGEKGLVSNTSSDFKLVMRGLNNRDIVVPVLDIITIAIESDDPKSYYCQPPVLEHKSICTPLHNDGGAFPPVHVGYYRAALIEYEGRVFYGYFNHSWPDNNFEPIAVLEKEEFIQKLENATRTFRERLDLYVSNIIALAEISKSHPDGTIAGFYSIQKTWKEQTRFLFREVFLKDPRSAVHPTKIFELKPGQKFSEPILTGFGDFDRGFFSNLVNDPIGEYAGGLDWTETPNSGPNFLLFSKNDLQMGEFQELFIIVQRHLPGSKERKEALDKMREIADRYNYETLRYKNTAGFSNLSKTRSIYLRMEDLK